MMECQRHSWHNWYHTCPATSRLRRLWNPKCAREPAQRAGWTACGRFILSSLCVTGGTRICLLLDAFRAREPQPGGLPAVCTCALEYVPGRGHQRPICQQRPWCLFPNRPGNIETSEPVVHRLNQIACLRCKLLPLRRMRRFDHDPRLSDAPLVTPPLECHPMVQARGLAARAVFVLSANTLTLPLP